MVDPAHVNTTRSFGTSSTNWPRARSPFAIVMAKIPPGTASTVAATPCQRDHLSEVVRYAFVDNLVAVAESGVASPSVVN